MALSVVLRLLDGLVEEDVLSLRGTSWAGEEVCIGTKSGFLLIAGMDLFTTPLLAGVVADLMGDTDGVVSMD
jgi:hypothetical protein